MIGISVLSINSRESNVWFCQDCDKLMVYLSKNRARILPGMKNIETCRVDCKKIMVKLTCSCGKKHKTVI